MFINTFVNFDNPKHVINLLKQKITSSKEIQLMIVEYNTQLPSASSLDQ